MGLHEPLAALTQAIKPGLTILDGHNFFRSENIFLAGDCVVEIDGLLMRLINSEEPHYIRMLREMGYATGEAAIHGEALPKCRPDKLRADRYKRFLNMRLWSNPRACSMCRMALHQVKGSCLRNLRSSARFYLRLLYYSIAGADLIFGSKPEYEALSRRVICIGDCTKGIAKANGYRHVPGCPPTLSQLMRYLGDE